MDDEGELEAEIEREIEQAEQERLAATAAKRRPKLLEVRVYRCLRIEKNSIQFILRLA